MLVLLEKGWGTSSHSLGVRDGGAPLLVNHVLSAIEDPSKNPWVFVALLSPSCSHAVWGADGARWLAFTPPTEPIYPIPQRARDKGLATLWALGFSKGRSEIGWTLLLELLLGRGWSRAGWWEHGLGVALGMRASEGNGGQWPPMTDQTMGSRLGAGLWYQQHLCLSMPLAPSVPGRP